MILFNVPSNISDEEIQSHLQAFQTNQCPLKIRFQFKGRLTNTRNLVFETPAAEFHKLKNIKKILIKWKMHILSESPHQVLQLLSVLRTYNEGLKIQHPFMC
ncbi:hypothetical protein AVEN_101611-1 [Araneus ventricosus]|uniref:RRM domain-containing protein n=1 Tax=Araneus ventricosus TaxID=182803 RepID=A0A4Y2EZG0_ARAVE|nr:hypothetical protein AVEN_101611-1 [Araneus ventricosus]